jgi:hypothetical protein
MRRKRKKYLNFSPKKKRKENKKEKREKVKYLNISPKGKERRRNR